MDHIDDLQRSIDRLTIMRDDDMRVIRGLQREVSNARVNQLKLSYIPMANAMYQIFMFVRNKEPKLHMLHSNDESHIFETKFRHLNSIQRAANVLLADIRNHVDRQRELQRMMQFVDMLHMERNSYLHPQSADALIEQAHHYAEMIEECQQMGDIIAPVYDLMHRVFSQVDKLVDARIGSFNPDNPRMLALGGIPDGR